MRHLVTLGLALITLPAAVTAIAQPRLSSSPGTIQVQSNLVVLDVSVTDAKGQPVTDLRKDEFRVFEQKAPQTISSFEPPAAHDLPAAAAGKLVVNSTADLPKIGQAPITLLLLDELNMTFEDRVYARTKLVEWLTRQPAILPQPTALTVITYKDFHVLRDYTQDRDALLAVLKKHVGEVDWRKDSTGRTGDQASEHMFATLGALEQIAQAMRGVPGRKNVIWVGDGFPSVNMGDVGRTSADEIAAALRRMSNVMLHARVTLSVIGSSIYFYKPVTIETQADEDMAANGNYDKVVLAAGDLQFGGLAAPTGGRAFTGRNDLDAEIGESVDAGASFYTLSYRPTDNSTDPKKYRHIRVEVTRPGLTVLTRDGYFPEPKTDPKDTARPETQQLAFDLFGAAFSTLAYTDMHVTAERAGPTDFTLHASAADMTWTELPDGRRHTDLVLLAVCLSPKNKMLSKTFETLGSNTSAPQSAINTVTTSLKMHVTPPPGTSRIRFVIRDMAAGRVGTADLTP